VRQANLKVILEFTGSQYEDFNLILGTRDYVVDITHHATFGSNRPSRGFPPSRGNITLL